MIDIEKIERNEHYDVPEGYFEQLPSRMINTIRKERATRRNLFFLSAAAVALLAIASTLFLNFRKQEQENQKQIVIEAAQEEKELEEQMIDYYNTELAQMDYYNF
ncbi:MAG: hypothetical protein II899_04890 [Bacteroidales bacterium]|nr:hypothetical protein [Bacteroidales bacterium]